MPLYEPRRIAFDDGRECRQETTVHWVADDDTVAMCGVTYPDFGKSRWSRPLKADVELADHACGECMRVLAAAGVAVPTATAGDA